MYYLLNIYGLISFPSNYNLSLYLVIPLYLLIVIISIFLFYKEYPIHSLWKYISLCLL